MKTVFTIMISICLLSNLKAQTKVEISDFEILNNSNWKGTLMYKNYSDGKEVFLRTTMAITLKNNIVITKIKFPDEPKANSKNTVKIRKKGTYFGNEKIIEKKVLDNNTLKIVTCFDGKDNNKKAKIYKTYIFNKETFIIIKEVAYLNSEQKFIRNKQNFKRI